MNACSHDRCMFLFILSLYQIQILITNINIFFCPQEALLHKYVTQQGVYHSFHVTDPHIDY